MATKISNQITFTEHKKIVAIKEWYLATSQSTGVTRDTEGWTTSVQNIDHTKKYLWNYEEVVYSLGDSDISEPAIIGVYGDAGASSTIAFLTNENVTLSANSNGEISATTFTTDIVAYSGTDLMDITIGNITDYPDGITYKVANNTVTFTVADKATLGSTSNCNGTINIPVTSPINVTLQLTWSKVNSGVGEDAKYIKLNSTCHVFRVDKNNTISPSTITITPTIKAPSDAKFKWWFAKDGGEFRTYWTNTGISVYTATETLDSQVELTQDDKTYVVIDGETFKNSKYNSLTIKFKSTSSPAYEDIITIYKTFDGADGADGADGKGISSVTNYYQITTDTTAPTTWETTAPMLTPENRFLWNYELITYTDNTTTTTDPAIIGVYGDSGDGMVTFEIYSPKGFVFKEDTEFIDLKVAAFEGNTPIENVQYNWQYWDERQGQYVDIDVDTTDNIFTVNKSDRYATSSLKCSMTYKGRTYEDYISLINETIIYSSEVKFFNGSNIFYADDLYLVAYVELYKNNDLIETVAADTYCTGISHISNGTISANITGNFETGDKMYFICQENGLYKVVLGEYNKTNNVWNVVNKPTEYTYTNSLHGDINSNVVAISKESINKSQKVDFTVLKNNVCLSQASVNLIDSNDPIISSSPPENPVYNQLWLDTSSSPYVLKIYTQSEDGSGSWVDCSEQIGGAVYTSRPTSYHEGDLWILAENESCTKYDAEGKACGRYEAGSMLRATKSSATSPMIAYLTNESIILAADNNGAVKQTTFTTDVVACSNTNFANDLVLGDITNLPSGITYTTSSVINGKQTIKFTVSDGANFGSTEDESGNIIINVLSPVTTQLSLKWLKVKGAYIESSGAKNIELTTTSYVIKENEDGSLYPSTIKITPIISNVSNNEALYWRISVNDGDFYTSKTGVMIYPPYNEKTSFSVDDNPYAEIDTESLKSATTELSTCSIRLRKSTNLTSLYYEDTITIHKLSYNQTFNAADWVDADEESTELKNNIKQYFSFDANTGLKIGQADEKFYVNIRSTEMGFYDNSMGQNQKVVSIGNNAAAIRNLAVYEEAEFNCNTTFNDPVKMFGFMWQEEDDESFSLVVVE